MVTYASLPGPCCAVVNSILELCLHYFFKCLSLNTSADVSHHKRCVFKTTFHTVQPLNASLAFHSVVLRGSCVNCAQALDQFLFKGVGTLHLHEKDFNNSSNHLNHEER